MSPEYALYGLFSIKSDVLSFGVFLLEILSGKKNTGFYLTDSVNLLGYAWDLWKSGMGQNLKDPILGDIPSTHMPLREDHGPGVFSLEFDPQGMPQFFILKGSQKYWTSGMYQRNFNCCRGLKLLINGICFGLNRASSVGFMPTVGLLAFAFKRPFHFANVCRVLNPILYEIGMQETCQEGV
ncbi:hypothetical protein TEA_013487 [Camellia sinensis var. sinensis]|uniref:Serine-threonine/tyrosine-protein kinase catalytic domain-containing protein n=1 Tax=Camellia sinensis var. sinensis TaxID=542762 RepID=A0A4S4EG23_CAMSN|nr:hypothetical protein TEA_013487 [Camellia sinensis var. sinensis]